MIHLRVYYMASMCPQNPPSLLFPPSPSPSLFHVLKTDLRSGPENRTFGPEFRNFP